MTDRRSPDDPSERTLPASGPLLRASGLGRRLSDGEGPGAWIWADLELELRSGELVTVRGPTGAGKSLLLRALAQLDSLQEGRLELHGRPADSYAPAEWRRRVVYLHQSPALLPGTVEDNLRAPFEWSVHGDRSYDRARALAWLEPLGRDPEWLEGRVPDLSGGERQLVALLRALLVEPTVLLLDEPTAALDPAATETVEKAVREWLTRSRDSGRAVLWVTHDLAQARRVGGRRLVLEEGELRPDPGRRASAGADELADLAGPGEA